MRHRLVEIGRATDVEFKRIPAIGEIARRVEWFLADSPPDRVAGQLYIGNHENAQRRYDEFEVMVSVGEGANGYPTGYYYPLQVHDREQYEMFKRAVGAVRFHYAKGDRTLVHCHEGRERAPSVVITAVAAETGDSWDGMMNRIHQKRPLIEPPVELRDLGIRYLESET